MQLVMRRQRLEAGKWHAFKINARMVINPEENELLTKYNLRDTVLTEGNMWRDMKRAGLFAIIPAVIAAPIIAGLLGVPFFPILVVSFVAIWAVVYQQIREEVRVSDLLTGRDFRARSFIGLLLKEQMIRKTSSVFALVIEQAKTWHEPEVIELEPQPLLTVLEGESREAA